jgi:NAD(P)H-binding
VVGTTRTGEKAPTLRAMGVEPVVVDVFDADALREAMAQVRPSIVVHQLTDLPAGLDPNKMADALPRNARIRDEGTRNLVSAALHAGVRRLIAQSLAFVYADGPLPHREADPLALDAEGDAGLTARGVASLERQVLEAPSDSSMVPVRASTQAPVRGLCMWMRPRGLPNSRSAEMCPAAFTTLPKRMARSRAIRPSDCSAGLQIGGWITDSSLDYSTVAPGGMKGRSGL